MILRVSRSERLAGIVGESEALYKRSTLSDWKGAEGCGVVSRQIIRELGFIRAAGR